MIPVNKYRMIAAREAAGLTVRQVGVHLDLDVRPGEYFGAMPADDLERAREIYKTRPGWLEEEGPVAAPGAAALLDRLGVDR